MKQLLLLLPHLARLLAGLLGDSRVPKAAKVALAAAAAYLASPVDLIPDFLPFVGYLDDVILVAVIVDGLLNYLARIIHECGPLHRTRPLTLPSPPSGARVQNCPPLPREGEGWGEGAMRVHELSALDRELLVKHWPGDPALLEKSAAVARRFAAWVPARIKARIFGGRG